MSKPPTVSDIARAARVSPSTVSRVLTGTTPVHPDKRAAVMAAIEQLQFRPNLAARSLVRGRSMAVGVLTQDPASQFYAELAEGVEAGLSGSGYHPVFASGHWRAADEREALQLLLARQVDALVVLAGELPDAELCAAAAQLPMIVVGRVVAGLEAQCLKVENFAGAYQAVRHLIDLNHRRIVHVTGLATQGDALERKRGYEQALRDAGLVFDEQLLVQGNFSMQGGLLALEMLLARGVAFSAIFAGNDQMAYGVRLGLYRRGLRVPDDISLVGFDDLQTSAFTTPPLTTVRQSMRDQGRLAAEAVLRILAGEPPALKPVATELVIRESTARLRY